MISQGEVLVYEMVVSNVATAASFYRDLGFHVRRQEAQFAELDWQGHLLMIESFSWVAAPPRGNLRILVEDADVHYARSRELGVTIVRDIASRSYGLRDFTIADPDGNELRFASRIPLEKILAGSS